MYDPGGHVEVMRETLFQLLPKARKKSVVVREGYSAVDGVAVSIPKVTLDSGASHGSYVGKKLLDKMPSVKQFPCKHSAKLGDGETILTVNSYCVLNIQLLDDYGSPTEPMYTELYVVDGLGDEVIIGLPDILGSYFDFFVSALTCGRNGTKLSILSEYERAMMIMDSVKREVARPHVRQRTIRVAQNKLRKVLHQHEQRKGRILSDPLSVRVIHNDAQNGSYEVVTSRRYGSVVDSDEFQLSLLNAIETCTQDADFLLAPEPGAIVDPWSTPPDTSCPEIDETPDPLSFSEDVLHFMEVSHDEAMIEYNDLLSSHISPEMAAACPKLLDLLTSPLATDVFVPQSWNGMRVEPIVFTTKPGLPDRLKPKARPVRPTLYESAKKEFDRLRQYFYVPSESPHASPLVIAPKATAPYIRFCGDYREINAYLDIPQQPIPIVVHELTKAAGFKVYVDMDMTNSFHQIPLSASSSDLLSVQTPWGLYKPSFLPEGVGPASGILQNLVREIFKDFVDWTVVIFDNFLILADDYDDAFQKLQRVLERCKEFGIVLKMKKSWIGVDKVTFFGYEVTHGKWSMSQGRKDAIAAMSMPRNTKEMQSFLGAALFFHHHIPNYSEWAAPLYAMTHESFQWDPGKWDKDYVGHFNSFKIAIGKAAELFFPDYTKQWIIRTDASQFAVGAVLFQLDIQEDGTVVHQPIAFASKRFSGPAQNWDTYKREAYGIFFAVHAFAYYLRGRDFIVETDHRNLQWIENSQSPIVVRWRALLQSYSFVIRHIPGKENTVADWMSRMYLLDGEEDLVDERELTVEEIMQHVHGGRELHFGATTTWKRAKTMFPDATISINQVREYVKQCKICQKTRSTGVTGLAAQTLSLKPPSYRRAVGFDHVTVTPPDDQGRTCVVLVVEHFSHFPQAYPAKDYSAEEVARILFKHFCTFGAFDEIVSDPGSAFTSAVMSQLKGWLGIRHKISLIGRHESNGCEASSREFLRHLRTLVLDERIVHKWSDDTVLPWINFCMASYPTSETGGYTPFQLKYGTEDAVYFRFPENPLPENAATVLRELDENLRLVRSRSLELQEEIKLERQSKDLAVSKYCAGDYVLWNQKEQSSDHLPTKLSTTWLGPYEVISQEKNDVTCKHLVLMSEHVFHVERLKPFFGTKQDAYDVAKLDRNQFFIHSIDFFTGNPHKRNSMMFGVMFEYETEIITVPYSSDIADTSQFHDYIHEHRYLFPLRFNAKEAVKQVASMKKHAIAGAHVGEDGYLSLRYFDGVDRAWYDTLHLPDKAKDYVVPIHYVSWRDNRLLTVNVYCALFDSTYVLTSYDVYALCYDELDLTTMVVVTDDLRQDYPQIWA